MPMYYNKRCGKAMTTISRLVKLKHDVSTSFDRRIESTWFIAKIKLERVLEKFNSSLSRGIIGLLINSKGGERERRDTALIVSFVRSVKKTRAFLTIAIGLINRAEHEYLGPSSSLL